MAKKVVAQVKLQCMAGKATPAPPVGPALGQHGVNIMMFVKQYNAQTQGMGDGLLIPVVVTVYSDKSFTFVLKTPPASVLISRAVGVDKGSSTPNKVKVGKITQQQLREIATTKLPDLNCSDVETAMSVISGTARSMGIEVESGS